MMKTQRQEEAIALQEETDAGQRLQTAILQQVMQQLGQPAARIRVQVRKLWEYRYRVNIITGVEIGSAVIAHSYFLVTDDNGIIVTASPRITKQY